MPYVNLPPGCSHLKFADGQKPIPAVRPGGRVFVSDERARAIDAMSGNGTAGLVTGAFRVFGTSPRAGRWCRSCTPARLWNPWNAFCPRCGSDTEPE